MGPFKKNYNDTSPPEQIIKNGLFAMFVSGWVLGLACGYAFWAQP